MKKFVFILLLALGFKANAQQNNSCGEYEIDQKYLKLDTTLWQRRVQLEKETAIFITNHEQSNAKINSDTILYVIPVVFHVMHDYGSEDISKEQILDAVRLINEDYQKINPDTDQVIPLFKPIIGDCHVEFRLAQLDPNGNCTDGITRHSIYLTNGGDDALKSIVQWPPDKYLNIWVENSCNGNFIAYSNYPGVAANLDGVMIMDEYVGSIGTSTNDPNVYRTLSHEIGHYLNLKHIWGDSNSPGLPTNCNVDDMVFDTPNTIGTTFSCNLNQSTCAPGVIDNVQNIMDYSSCDYMFTQGQCLRMQAALNSGISDRNNLWATGNRILTGTNDGYPVVTCSPVADFSDHKIRVCTGQSVTFKNDSFGGDFTAINWQFTGGNISTSNDTNPTVQYNTAGIFDVILTVSNNAGTSTVTRTGLVQVDDIASQTAVPYVEDFENLVFPSGFWDYDNNAGSHWETTSLASASGIKSIYLNHDSLNVGTADIFYTGGYNFSSVSSPVFSFKIAFANHNSSNDNLKIYMSVDCGQTWVLKYYKSGNSLSTTSDTAANFIPVTTDWRQDAMNILSTAGQSNVRFKFQFTSNGGNNIFIDDINISGVTGFDEINEDVIGLAIFPNPAKDKTKISFELMAPELVSYSVCDVTGRVIKEMSPKLLSATSHTLTIDKTFASGLYFVNVRIGEKSFVRKLVFD